MREILYKYNNRGLYETADDTSFADDSHIKIIVEPHNFSLAIGGETLRDTSFDGCTAVVSCEGEVVFYDNENSVLGRADKTENRYEKAIFTWQQDLISIQFGHTVVVDYYPNCDGEYDRYGEEWAIMRSVSLNLKDNSVEIK